MTTTYATKNDLPEPVRSQAIDLLNARLADAVDLMLQAKHAHWNVKGSTFFSLHELFDKVAEDIEDYVDLIAERAVQLGGVARGTADVAAKNTSLVRYPETAVDGSEHVEALSSALSAFGKSVRAAIETSAGWGDADTSDLFTEVSRGVDKWLWFVEAHTQRSGK